MLAVTTGSSPFTSPLRNVSEALIMSAQHIAENEMAASPDFIRSVMSGSPAAAQRDFLVCSEACTGDDVLWPVL